MTHSNRPAKLIYAESSDRSTRRDPADQLPDLAVSLSTPKPLSTFSRSYMAENRDLSTPPPTNHSVSKKPGEAKERRNLEPARNEPLVTPKG